MRGTNQHPPLPPTKRTRQEEATEAPAAPVDWSIFYCPETLDPEDITPELPMRATTASSWTNPYRAIRAAQQKLSGIGDIFENPQAVIRRGWHSRIISQATASIHVSTLHPGSASRTTQPLSELGDLQEFSLAELMEE